MHAFTHSLHLLTPHTSSSERRPVLVPASTSTRSRYVIERRADGSFGFELRAHNGHCLLSNERDQADLDAALALVERVRSLIVLSNAQLTDQLAGGAPARDDLMCRQSLTGKWYFVVSEPGNEAAGQELVLASSKPFDYRSRMDKALYAVRCCAPSSRVVVPNLDTSPLASPAHSDKLIPPCSNDSSII